MYINRYEQFISVLEDMEHMEIAAMVENRKKTDSGKRYSLDEVIK